MSKPTERHTIHLPDGNRVEVTGDRYEIHLSGPIVVYRKHWVGSFTAAQEVERTIDYGPPRQVKDALEAAFKTIPQVIYGDDDE